MIDISIEQVMTQIIAFLIMFWILKRYAWRPLLGILEERKNKIQLEFDSIDEQKKQTQELTDKYNKKLMQIEAESKSHIQEAIKEGRKAAQTIQEQAQQQAKNILAKAHLDAEDEVARAKGEMRKELISVAIAIAQKILEEEIDPQKHEHLIEDFVEAIR